MSKPAIRIFALSVLGAVLLAGMSFGQTDDKTFKPTQFRGRFFTGGAGNMSSVLTTKIQIDGFTTKEEVYALAEAYNAKGEDGFRDKFRSFKKGKIQVVGASGLNIEFHAVKEIAKENGFQYQLIAENADFQPGGGRKSYLGLMFLVVILELDLKGSGEGRIYEDANVEFTAEGELKLSEFKRAPKIITAIVKQK
jgi:hypothetical protein